MTQMLDYQSRDAGTAGRGSRIRGASVAGILAIGLLLLAASPLLLATPGGRVGYYLCVGLAAIPALGWSRVRPLKVIAAGLIVLAGYLAHSDHVAGQDYQLRMLKMRYSLPQSGPSEVGTEAIDGPADRSDAGDRPHPRRADLLAPEKPSADETLQPMAVASTATEHSDGTDLVTLLRQDIADGQQIIVTLKPIRRWRAMSPAVAAGESWTAYNIVVELRSPERVILGAKCYGGATCPQTC